MKTVATVLINEINETEAETPVGALAETLVMREDGQLMAIVSADPQQPMAKGLFRVTGSLEQLEDRWRYVGSTVYGMGVYHLWQCEDTRLSYMPSDDEEE